MSLNPIYNVNNYIKQNYISMQLLIVLLIFTVPACILLSKKNRGAGYYILAILFPLIGLIFALCLKKLNPEEKNLTPPTLDITEDNQKTPLR